MRALLFIQRRLDKFRHDADLIDQIADFFVGGRNGADPAAMLRTVDALGHIINRLVKFKHPFILLFILQED